MAQLARTHDTAEDHEHDKHDNGGRQPGHAAVGHVHARSLGPMVSGSLIITLVFVVAEFLAGRIANSLALISDAGHNLSDAIALGLAACAIWIAKKPATAKKPMGIIGLEYSRPSLMLLLSSS